MVNTQTHTLSQRLLIKGCTHLAVSSATAWPCPKKSARTSMPSSAHTVESTSKHTACAVLSAALALVGSSPLAGPEMLACVYR